MRTTRECKRLQCYSGEETRELSGQGFAWSIHDVIMMQALYTPMCGAGYRTVHSLDLILQWHTSDVTNEKRKEVYVEICKLQHCLTHVDDITICIFSINNEYKNKIIGK